jgi:hypothetical protein
MTQEAIFQDLEAQFASENRCFEIRRQLALCTRLRLAVASQEFRLAAPILGSDFVVGFDGQRSAWMCFGKSKLSRLRFEVDEDPQLPKLRKRTGAFENFIAEMNPPFAVELKPSGSPSFAAALTGAEAGLAFYRPSSNSKPLSAIALASLDWLAILEAQDAQELSDWRNR